MRSRMVKKVALTSAFAAVMCLGTGCTTTIPTSDPSDHQNSKLRVESTSGDTYALSSWHVLPNGDIQGRGIRSSGDLRLEFDGTIESSRIRSLGVDTYDGTKTAVGIVGSVAAAAGVVYVVRILSITGEKMPKVVVPSLPGW